jgi:hypothetical protein
LLLFCACTWDLPCDPLDASPKPLVDVKTAVDVIGSICDTL